MDRRKGSFFRYKLVWLCVCLLLLVIIVVIVIFPKQDRRMQEKIIFDEYTTTHSLTRYYTEKDYERSAQLIKAIRARDHDRVKKLLATKMEVNAPDRAEIDWTDIENEIFPAFPLTVACAGGNYKIVRALIENGAVVNDELLGITVFTFHADDLSILQLLVEHGADASQEGLALTAAAMTERTRIDRLNWGGTVAIFKFLEQNGADIYEVDEGRNNVVIKAAHTDNVHLLKYLIEEKKMDINYTNKYQTTALKSASASGKVNSVRYLVDQGADQTIKGNVDGGEGYYYLTALEVAQKYGHEEVVRILSGSE